MNKFFNKLRALGIFLFLVLEFIFSGLRIILFSQHEVVDFQLDTDANRDTLNEAIQTRSYLEQVETALYPEEETIFIIGEDDMEEE